MIKRAIILFACKASVLAADVTENKKKKIDGQVIGIDLGTITPAMVFLKTEELKSFQMSSEIKLHHPMLLSNLKRNL